MCNRFTLSLESLLPIRLYRYTQQLKNHRRIYKTIIPAFLSLPDWYNENDYVPIIEGWINRFSMFAAVVRPKRDSFSVPPSGLVWRPAEDGRISLAFPSGCFNENADTSCIVKVMMFLSSYFLRYFMLLVYMMHDLLIVLFGMKLIH